MNRNEISGYINLPFMFASTEAMTLSVDRFHVIERWSERVNQPIIGEKQCLQMIARLLENESLITIYERVPIYGTVALYLENENVFLFLSMGTRASQSHVRVSTIIYRENDSKRVLVDKNDFCYVLFKDGTLRYGKNKKYFEFKTKSGYNVSYA